MNSRSKTWFCIQIFFSFWSGKKNFMHYQISLLSYFGEWYPIKINEKYMYRCVSIDLKTTKGISFYENLHVHRIYMSHKYFIACLEFNLSPKPPQDLIIRHTLVRHCICICLKTQKLLKIEKSIDGATEVTRSGLD